MSICMHKNAEAMLICILLLSDCWNAELSSNQYMGTFYKYKTISRLSDPYNRSLSIVEDVPLKG